MKLLSEGELSSIFYTHVCSTCGEALFDNKAQIIKITTTLCFIKCNLCRSAFKLRRRVMKHPKDLYIYEIGHNDDETNYATKGYHIKKATFEKNLIKYQIKKNYGHFIFSEEDFLIDN